MNSIKVTLIGLTLILACSACRQAQGSNIEPDTSAALSADPQGVLRRNVSALDPREGQMISSSGSGRQEITRSNGDGTQIKTLHDGYGNVTEIRSFYGEQLISLVVVRTGLSGERSVTVYDRYGHPFGAPASFTHSAMTAPSREIAKALGIIERPKPVQPVTPEFADTGSNGTFQSDELAPEEILSESNDSPIEAPPKTTIGTASGDVINAERLRKKLQDLSLTGPPR